MYSNPSSYLTKVIARPRQRYLSTRGKQIPMYDFNRFNNAYNYGKPLRWPLKNLKITPFIRQEWDDSDQTVSINMIFTT
jgi:hypothetical protein